MSASPRTMVRVWQLNLAMAHRHLGRLGEAVEYATEALTISRQLGWRELEASARNGLGVTLGEALAYTATTLAWSGDPAAEEYTRTAVRLLESPENGPVRPRRVASAKLDLALALLAAGKPDEAAAVAAAAIASGRVVPSNWWRASEIVAATDALRVREASELREIYEAHRPIRPA